MPCKVVYLERTPSVSTTAFVDRIWVERNGYKINESTMGALSSVATTPIMSMEM